MPDDDGFPLDEESNYGPIVKTRVMGGEQILQDQIDNLPVGIGDMFKANNLSDLVDIEASRTNLDVFSKAETDSAIDVALGGISGVTLLAGQSGGQVVHGGTDAADDLTLSSTADATKGTIVLEDATTVGTIADMALAVGSTLAATNLVVSDSLTQTVAPTETREGIVLGLKLDHVLDYDGGTTGPPWNIPFGPRTALPLTPVNWNFPVPATSFPMGKLTQLGKTVWAADAGLNAGDPGYLDFRVTTVPTGVDGVYAGHQPVLINHVYFAPGSDITQFAGGYHPSLNTYGHLGIADQPIYAVDADLGGTISNAHTVSLYSGPIHLDGTHAKWRCGLYIDDADAAGNSFGDGLGVIDDAVGIQIVPLTTAARNIALNYGDPDPDGDFLFRLNGDGSLVSHGGTLSLSDDDNAHGKVGMFVGAFGVPIANVAVYVEADDTQAASLLEVVDGIAAMRLGPGGTTAADVKLSRTSDAGAALESAFGLTVLDGTASHGKVSAAALDVGLQFVGGYDNDTDLLPNWLVGRVAGLYPEPGLYLADDDGGSDVMFFRGGDAIGRFIAPAGFAFADLVIFEDGIVGSTASGGDLTIGSTSHATKGTIVLSDDVEMGPGKNIATDTTTGTKLGTGVTQKLGFFNATPVAQQANTVDLGAVLSTLGFRASGGNPPLNLGTGALTAGVASVRSPFTVSDGTTTDGAISGGVGNIGVPLVTLGILRDSTDTQLAAALQAVNGAPSLVLGPGGSTSPDVTLARTGTAAATLTGQITIATGLTFASGKNIATNTTTGTIIAATTSQKLGFWGATAVIQPASASQAAVGTTAPAGGTGIAAGGWSSAADRNTAITTINSCVTLVNQLRSDLVSAGVIKGAA